MTGKLNLKQERKNHRGHELCTLIGNKNTTDDSARRRAPSSARPSTCASGEQVEGRSLQFSFGRLGDVVYNSNNALTFSRVRQYSLEKVVLRFLFQFARHFHLIY